MHQTVFTGKDRHKGTKINDARNLTGVNLTDLCLSGNGLNHLDRSISRSGVLTEDFDCAVVININRRTRFFRNLANGGAALADNVAYLILINLERCHARRILRGDLARCIQTSIHLPENMQSRL